LGTVIFTYTVKIRQPWFGTLSQDHHQWLTGSTLKFAKNWYNEGPASLKFAMLENPRSIEFQSLKDREIYPSYPPGVVVPFYVIGKILNREPDPAILMGYNLANQLLIAVVLSLTAFIFLRFQKFSHLSSFVFALIPLMLELLMPAPMYWHQNVVFSDQLIILPFVLFIFLEMLRGILKNKSFKVVKIIQPVIFFIGIFLDWFFVFVALFVFLKRLLNGELGKKFTEIIKNSFLFAIPALLAMSVFGYQLYVLDVFPALYQKFLFRAGINDFSKTYMSRTDFFKRFWVEHMSQNYSVFTTWLLWGALAVVILSLLYLATRYISKKHPSQHLKDLIFLASLFILPVFTKIYFLKQHSWDHDFTTLAFSPAIALIPLVLFPAGILLVILKYKKNIKFSRISAVVSIISFILACLYISSVFPKYKNQFPEPNLQYKIIGDFLIANTTYSDVLFSPNFEISSFIYPQQLSYSKKRVYLVKSATEIKKITEKIRAPYNIKIFFRIDTAVQTQWESSLLTICTKKVVSGDMILCDVRLKSLDSLPLKVIP